MIGWLVAVIAWSVIVWCVWPQQTEAFLLGVWRRVKGEG